MSARSAPPKPPQKTRMAISSRRPVPPVQPQIRTDDDGHRDAGQDEPNVAPTGLVAKMSIRSAPVQRAQG